MPRYWLLKSEPGDYSITDLERDSRTAWDGIRNYQARNFLRDEVAAGDGVLYYHSSVNPPGVAGTARVVRSGYPDATARDPESPQYDSRASEADPRWYMVDVEFVEAFPDLVPLDALRAEPALEDMLVTRNSRLSVQPVTEAEFRIVQAMGRKGGGAAEPE